MIPQTLIRYIETEIIPRYEHFDKAHNLSHVQTVIDESLALAKLYPQADERLVYTIAAYHDTGLCRDRATHHLVSGEIIAADANLLQWFDKAEIKIMREAVEDHRASTDHEPRSIYGKIVAEADRIIDADITLRRTVQYGLKQNRSMALPTFPQTSDGEIRSRRLSEALVFRLKERRTAERAANHHSG